MAFCGFNIISYPYVSAKNQEVCEENMLCKKVF